MAEFDFAKALVHPRKLFDYLLAEDHPEGGPKARFFLACGFRREHSDIMVAALRKQAARGELTTIAAPFRTKLVVEGLLECPDGRARRIRSVWVALTDTFIHLVTAYPREPLNDDR